MQMGELDSSVFPGTGVPEQATAGVEEIKDTLSIPPGGFVPTEESFLHSITNLNDCPA